MVIIPQLIEIVGEGNVSTDDSDLNAYGRDWTRFYEPDPLAIVFVRSIDQVIALVNLARTEQVGLVPSGGRTGLSGGACATAGEIVVSFDKMNKILEFDAADSSVTMEPGVITADLQAFADQQGLHYPVDFASSGSSQIGGNIATNAGGIRVVRYGLTRDQVSGLKVVTGKGELLSLNKGLTKNATGYDLRHLFIGSEGTLGFIVEATLQLSKTPSSQTVVLLAVGEMADCLNILTTFRSTVELSAFEFFSQNALNHVLANSELTEPFREQSPYYVLLEFEQSADNSLDQALSAFNYCTEKGWADDGIVASSDKQNAELWQYRERISESISPRTPYKTNVSVRISQVPKFLQQIDELVSRLYPRFEIVWFGHIGDGNLHLNILRPDEMAIDSFKSQCDTVSELLLELVEEFGGSISAEHGVGLLKKNQLHFTRSEQEIDAMRAIKAIFDPSGIMHPGKLF